ncbi:unnamed protein product, partial [Pylaiella littoralis]
GEEEGSPRGGYGEGEVMSTAADKEELGEVGGATSSKGWWARSAGRRRQKKAEKQASKRAAASLKHEVEQLQHFKRLAILAAEERERELRLLDEALLREAAVGRESEEAGERRPYALKGSIETLESDSGVDTAVTATATAGRGGRTVSSQLAGDEHDDRSEPVDSRGRGMDGRPGSELLWTESFGGSMDGGDQRGTGDYHPSGTSNDSPSGGGEEGIEVSGPLPGAGQQQQQQQHGQETPAAGEEKKSWKRVRAAVGVVAAAAYYAVWVAVALVLG